MFSGFKWEALPEATLIADVGGGNGSLSFCIADDNPHLHFTLVDRPAVLKDVAIPVGLILVFLCIRCYLFELALELRLS